MRSNLGRAGIVAVAGGLLILSGTSPLLGDDTRTGVQVIASKLVKGIGEVTLFNPSKSPQSGMVVVEVQQHGKRNLVLAPFTVWGGNKAFVRWALTDPLAEIIRVGIIVDDGAPF
jgi:hypothetical protein